MELYDTHTIPGKEILKVSLFAYLDDIFGNEMSTQHDSLWMLLSGEASDDILRKLLTDFYDSIPCFANFCDIHYYFGDPSKTYFERLMGGIKEVLESARTEVSKFGGRYLGEDRGYVYYAFEYGSMPKNVKGSQV